MTRKDETLDTRSLLVFAVGPSAKARQSSTVHNEIACGILSSHINPVSKQQIPNMAAAISLQTESQDTSRRLGVDCRAGFLDLFR